MTQTDAHDDLAYLGTRLGGDLDVMLVYNLLRTHNYLAPFLDAELRAQRLTATQLNALLVLHNAGREGLLMGEIGERLVVTKSNVTGLVDRLEKQGLVSRSSLEDRRATAVRITPAGRKLLQGVLPHHTRLLAELTDCLEPAEKKTLVGLLTKLRRELRHRRKGRP